MTELNTDERRGLLDEFRHVVKALGDLVGFFETVIASYDELQEQHASLERDHQAVQQTYHRLREEHAETARTLAELQTSNELLLREYEAGTRALQDLRDRLRNKAYALERLYAGTPETPSRH